MSALILVLSHLSGQINMLDDLSHEMCSHKTEFPLIKVPIMWLRLYLEVCKKHIQKRKNQLIQISYNVTIYEVQIGKQKTFMKSILIASLSNHM